MCPIAARGDNNVPITDDDCAALLRRIARGIPTPEYVLDVNPFVHHAENLPEGILFLVNWQDPRNNEAGYWVETGRNTRISSESPTVDKTTMQFYEGRVPDGNITVWLMHIYKLDRTEQYTKWLCRRELDMVLWLANLARMEENNRGSSNESEVVNGNERKPPATSESSIQNNPFPDLGEFNYDDGYLELDDLIDYASSSSPENSSGVSVNSEYYLDSEVSSFREMPNDGNPGSHQRNVNRFMVSATRGSNQVLMRPPPGSEYNIDPHAKSKEIRTADPKNKGDGTLPAATTDRGGSQVGKKLEHVAGAREGNALTNAGPSNSSDRGKKGGCSLAKMGMKFLCFSP
ncbi:NAC domain-containing protein 69-like [Aristolochia californica]|uniref:NAC domain-containing protein 69-like n=1 Tax=Aristolochia californica TaxID=171875 RepID=UPI0035E01105